MFGLATGAGTCLNDLTDTGRCGCIIPIMTIQPEHYNPIGKQDTLDTWRKRMRMPVPTKVCYILDVRIVALYETNSVNGLPLDALIEARITEERSPVQFGAVFGPSPPDWDQYGIPILWIDDRRTNVGRWKGMVQEPDDRFC